MKTIYCITGANGHLGNVLVQKLCLLGHQVRALMLPGDQSHLALPTADHISGKYLRTGHLDGLFRLPAG